MTKSIDEALALANKQQGSKLQISYGATLIKTGQHVPKAETQTIPKISVVDVGTGPFLLKCVDLDAPFPSLPFMSPILHWTQHNLIPDSSRELAAPGSPFIVDYVGAGPPPFSSPHRYLFILYEQPEGFDYAKFAPPNGQKAGISQRARFDYEKFVHEAGLGRIVAANWFESN